jgi:hypothetical protein
MTQTKVAQQISTSSANMGSMMGFYSSKTQTGVQMICLRGFDKGEPPRQLHGGAIRAPRAILKVWVNRSPWELWCRR